MTTMQFLSVSMQKSYALSIYAKRFANSRHVLIISKKFVTPVDVTSMASRATRYLGRCRPLVSENPPGRRPGRAVGAQWRTAEKNRTGFVTLWPCPVRLRAAPGKSRMSAVHAIAS